MRLTKSGTAWLIDGVPAAPRFQSAFGLARLLYNGHLNEARAFLQRARAVGAHGVRVFLETHSWAGQLFWGQLAAAPWDLSQPVNSRFKLSPTVQRGLEDLVQLLQDENMIADVTINATIKEGPGPLGGEFVARNAAYWERMQRAVLQWAAGAGVPSGLSGLIVWENCNEWAAHTRAALRAHMRRDPNGVDLLAVMSRRAQEDFPGCLYGISDGSTWDFNWPLADYTHINIHTPRNGSGWQLVDDEVRELRAMWSLPVSLNENNFYMTPEQWSAHPQFQHQATEDVQKLQTQWRGAAAAGAAYCLHNMNGVLSDPDAPLDAAERAFAADAGASPPPDWSDDASMADARIVRLAYREVLGREADANGFAHYVAAVAAGMTEAELREVLLRSPEGRR